jgi:serine/threonine protein kinase
MNTIAPGPSDTCAADDRATDWAAARQAAGPDAGLQNGLHRLAAVADLFRAGRTERARSVHAPQAAFRFAGLDAIEKIGGGSQGDVWRAYDPALARHVALKLKRRSAGALSCALLEEGRKLAKLSHRNIVKVHGAALECGDVGIWMELVRGASLREVVSDSGAMDPAEVVALGKDVCSALAEMHRAGFVHGDVKPDNVMRDDEGRAVLLDLGSARALDCSDASLVSGTRAYVAPEILEGGAPTPASDVYALAMMMFYLLTTRLPRCGEVRCCTHHWIRSSGCCVEGAAGHAGHGCGGNDKVRSLLPGVPDGLARLVEAALSRDPRRRPHTTEEFGRRLTRLGQRPSVATLRRMRALGGRLLRKLG